MGILKRKQRYLRLNCNARTAGLVAACLAGLLVCGIASAQSEPSEPSEYQVKAAFLFNFTKFVEWPEGSFEDPQAPIVVGIIGDDPFGDDLERIIAGQKVQGRGLVIRRERWGDDLRRCQVLFVSASEHEHSSRILGSVQSAGVLTVSDMEGFAEAGGVIEFVTQENRVRFIVNLDSATQSKLHLSAKLLALARVIGHSQVER
jgi:hypothetical protein